MDSRLYWEENGHSVHFDGYNSNDGYRRSGNLNFASGGVANEDSGDYINSNYKKGKVSRQDPMSHRIIEKRRRDRMNNCLADLSRLIPADYLKKGRGRVEKTEIIEMAIRHLKYLQDRYNCTSENSDIRSDHFRMGYNECLAEVMRYLVESQGYEPADTLCTQLVGHLNRHCDNIMKGEQIQPSKIRSNPDTTSSSSSSGVYASGNSNNGASGDSTLINDDEPLDARTHHRPTDETDATQNYKFKNKIERRFSSQTDDERRNKRRRCSTSSALETCDDPNIDDNIAVFALHTDCKHYVPLSLAATKLGPSAKTLLSQRPHTLHPITISVAFHTPPPICLKSDPDEHWHYL